MSNDKKINRLEILRHSTAHILAAAVLEMFPEAKFGIGPAIENGFYYDFDLPRTLIPEDLPILEEKMKAIIKANYKFERAEILIDEARKDFQKAGQIYKVELLKEIQSNPSSPLGRGCREATGEGKGAEKVSIYKTGSFVDLCRGPHLDSTGEIPAEAMKLTKISGAYWKGDEKNKMLQRIYGVAFSSKKELDAYLEIIKEAEKRDHKKLGRELDMFSFHPEAPGSPFWHPKGMIVWNILENLGKSLRKKYYYQEIQTPILAKSVLWKTSGHWDHYQDSMFHFESDKEEYAIKPMDCPFNILLYKEKKHSYKELPIRFSEIGRVMRNEKSGELNGLLRVRHITQDDSHIFLEKNQIEKEIQTLLEMAREYYNCFGLEPKFYLSTRPEDFMGEIEDWDVAEENLKNALEKSKAKYEVKEKDGAFYGPKIDIDINDALGRNWQLATIQLDFQLPQKFSLEYVGEKGEKKMPVMIHAAIFGSIERFMGIITEHYAGAFPAWLSPVQVTILPVSEKFADYARSVEARFIASQIRVEIDASDESLGKRIRAAKLQKIPYILVVGEKEEKDGAVAVNSRDNDSKETMKVGEFLEKIRKEIGEKK